MRCVRDAVSWLNHFVNTRLAFVCISQTLQQLGTSPKKRLFYIDILNRKVINENRDFVADNTKLYIGRTAQKNRIQFRNNQVSNSQYFIVFL